MHHFLLRAVPFRPLPSHSRRRPPAPSSELQILASFSFSKNSYPTIQQEKFSNNNDGFANSYVQRNSFFSSSSSAKIHKKNCGNWRQKERKRWCNTRTWEKDRREETKGQRSQRAPPLLLSMPLPRIATLFDLTLSIWFGLLTPHFSSVWTTLLHHNAVSKNAMHVSHFIFCVTWRLYYYHPMIYPFFIHLNKSTTT